MAAIPELFWFLLPVAAASGWLIARQSYKSGGRSRSQNLSPEYYRGLNYLLNEDQDKALDVFLRLVQADSETLETHLALGGLFRRRGEVERAIRIHQNLLARPNLDSSQRSIALMELGKDYMHAGLLDRAESILLDVVNHQSQQAEALEHLLTIYQRETEWEKAIETVKQMGTATDPKVKQIIAHCYCEIAEASRLNGTPQKVTEALQTALSIDPGSVRANILLGDIAYEEEKYIQAYRYYLKIFEIDRDYVPEVLGKISKCIEQGVKAAEFDEYLAEMADGPMQPGLSHYILQEQGEQSARKYVQDHLQQTPTLSGLKEWFDLEMGADNLSAEQIKRVPEILHRLVKQWPSYQCRHCGFRSAMLNWQCPTCKSWSTVVPGKQS